MRRMNVKAGKKATENRGLCPGTSTLKVIVMMRRERPQKERFMTN